MKNGKGEKVLFKSYYFRLDAGLSKNLLKLKKEMGAISKSQVIRHILLEYFKAGEKK